MKPPSPALQYSIFANPTTDHSGQRCASLNVMTAHYGLVVLLTADEVAHLHQNDPGEWDERGSLRLGRCHENPVFWSADSETLSILSGHDDESWSTSFILPLDQLAVIRRELLALSPWLSGLSLPPGYAGHVPADYAHLHPA
jgi:hypothetical protein